MGLETGTLIPDFNSSWPLGSDDVSQGDDHIRLIKSILQNVFPGNTGPLAFTGVSLQLIEDGGQVGGDLLARDIEIRAASIQDEIKECPQVAIALGILDGVTVTLTNGQFGTVSVSRTAGEAVGSYDVVLTESPDLDTVGGGSAQFGLALDFTVQVLATLDAFTVRVQCRQAGNGALVDAPVINFFVMDAGRN